VFSRHKTMMPIVFARHPNTVSAPDGGPNAPGSASSRLALRRRRAHEERRLAVTTSARNDEQLSRGNAKFRLQCNSCTGAIAIIGWHEASLGNNWLPVARLRGKADLERRRRPGALATEPQK
jgi:hypothetical protein